MPHPKGAACQLQFSIRVAKLSPEIKALDCTRWAGDDWRGCCGQSLGRDSETRPDCTERVLGRGVLVRSPPAPAVPQERVLRPAPPDGPCVEVQPPHLPSSQRTWRFLKMVLSLRRGRPGQPPLSGFFAHFGFNERYFYGHLLQEGFVDACLPFSRVYLYRWKF